MDLYALSLYLGGAGLGLMAATGLMHSHGEGHGTHGHSHGHHGHGPAAGGHHGHHGHDAGAVAHHSAHAHHGDSHHAAHHSARDHSGGRSFFALLSPRVWFSVLVGLGATGLLARDFVGEPWLAMVAAAGGIAFEWLIVAPIWRFTFRFASAPALTLDSSLFDAAEAASRFDRNGQGLVLLELDGQMLQLLGTLCAEDRAAGVHVRAGDRLRVEAVDGARNRCTVSYVGSSERTTLADR